MKQQITANQFYQLSKKAQKKWFDWAIPRKYASGGMSTVSLPSIGQMIEFLDEKNTINIQQFKPLVGKNICTQITFFTNNRYKELCDALWETVKEILEK